MRIPFSAEMRTTEQLGGSSWQQIELFINNIQSLFPAKMHSPRNMTVIAVSGIRVERSIDRSDSHPFARRESKPPGFHFWNYLAVYSFTDFSGFRLPASRGKYQLPIPDSVSLFV
jgi:hypothetical protein